MSLFRHLNVHKISFTTGDTLAVQSVLCCVARISVVALQCYTVQCSLCSAVLCSAVQLDYPLYLCSEYYYLDIGALIEEISDIERTTTYSSEYHVTRDLGIPGASGPMCQCANVPMWYRENTTVSPQSRLYH